MPRSQLNIRIDDSRKKRWHDAARSQGLELTAWMFLHLDDAAREAEQQQLVSIPPQSAEQRGAYGEP